MTDFLAAGVVWLVPLGIGFLLLRSQSRFARADAIECLGLSYALGLAAFGWAFTLGGFVHARLETAGSVVLAASVLACLARARRSGVRGWLPPVPLQATLVLGLIVGVFWYHTANIGSWETPGSDAFRHLAFMRRLSAVGVLADQSYVLSADLPVNLLNASYAYNPLHALFALASRVFQVDVVVLYFHAPQWVFALTVCCFYTAGKQIFGSGAHGVAAVFAWCVALGYYGEYTGLQALIHNAYFTLSLAAVVAAWVVVLVFHEKPRRLDLFALALAIVSVSLYHLQWWLIFWLFLAGLMAVTAASRRRDELRSLGLMAAMALVLFPLTFLLRASFYAQVSGDMSTAFVSGYQAQLVDWGSMHAAAPGPLFGLVGAAAALSLAFLVGYRRFQDPGKIFAAAFAAGGLLSVFVLLNPLTFQAIERFASTSIAFRLVAPIVRWFGVMVLTFCLVAAYRWLRGHREVSGTTAAGFAIAGTTAFLALLFWLPGSEVQKNVSHWATEKRGKIHLPALRRLPPLQELFDAIPQDDIVLARRLTRNFLCAFHAARVNGTLNPVSERALALERQIDTVFQTETPPATVVRTLRELGSDFLLAGPREDPGLLQRFDQMPELTLLKQVEIQGTRHLDGRYWLYRVN